MSDDKKLSVLGHLAELRQRLIKSLIAVAVTTGLSFIFADRLFEVLKWPAGDVQFIYIEMTEMIGTYMKVCLVSGIILAMPVIVYQFLMFIAPALSPKEKRVVFMVAPWIGLMFAGGVVFGYFVLVPPSVKFLVSFGTEIATPQIRIGNYISIVTRLLLAIGFVFETPVITTFLARLGVVSAQWLASKRRIAIVGSFILAAIITPTWDPINQTLVAVPLIVLYELGILLARIVGKKKPAPVAALDSAS